MSNKKTELSKFEELCSLHNIQATVVRNSVGTFIAYPNDTDENKVVFMYDEVKEGFYQEITPPNGPKYFSLKHLTAQDVFSIITIKSEVTSNSNSFTKADNGKLQWSLMPFEQLEDVVCVLMNGAKKYSKDNWKKCDDTKRYEDALMRHVVAYTKGEKIDDKAKGGDGLPHLAHAICNCLFLMWFDSEENGEDL